MRYPKRITPMVSPRYKCYESISNGDIKQKKENERDVVFARELHDLLPHLFDNHIFVENGACTRNILPTTKRNKIKQQQQ